MAWGVAQVAARTPDGLDEARLDRWGGLRLGGLDVGAHALDIVRLLLWQFSIPVLIANVIAWPVAYYYLHHWLAGYAYRIELSPLYFVAVGTAALGVAWITVLGHAMRVARRNPIFAMRYE